MRIVHLSTSDCAGGAARAAFRLHKGLLAEGVDSKMLVQKKVSKLASVEEIPADANVLRFWQWLEEFYIARNRTEISNTYFSLGYPGVNLAEHPAVREADIIHLHWVAGFQSPVSIAALQRLEKPIVWSCHDERAFTGGCHYTFGSQGYARDCAECPQLKNDPLSITVAQLADQKSLLDAKGITILAPSRWMGNVAASSVQFKQSRIEVIPYGLETETFRAINRKEARKNLNISDDAFCFLFGADAISERRKGFQELLAALRICSADPGFVSLVRDRKVVFLCFGRPDKSLESIPVPIQSSGYISSDEQMAQLYVAADLFVLPSLQDNLPNTMLEAMSCGTPVMGFNVGGIPDVVEDGVTGVLVQVGNTKAFAEAIRSVVRPPSRITAMRPACRQKMENRFTLQHQAKTCLGLYDDLLHTRPSFVSPAKELFGPEFNKRFHQLVSLCIERFTADQPRWESADNAKNNAKLEAERLKNTLSRFEPAQSLRWAAEFVGELDSIAADRKRHRRRLGSRIKKLLHFKKPDYNT